MRNHLAVTAIFCMVFFGLVFAVEADEPWTMYDFEGRTVTYTSRVGGEVEMILNPDEEQAAHLEWVEEVFNVKLDARHYDGSADDLEADTITGVLAGDPPGDILSNHTRCMQVNAAEGVLYPLDDILESQNYFDNIHDYFVDHQHFYQHDGVTYAINSLHTPSGDVMWWNKSLFEREGMPNLYDLWRDYEWDWDTFREIAEQLQRDTTGDGEIDQFGYANSSAYLGRFAHSNNADYAILNEETGRWEVGITEPEFIEAAQFFQDLWMDGLANPDFHGDAIDMLNDGTLGMHARGLWSGGAFLDSEDHIGMVPIPMGPSADDYALNHWNARPFFFPITEEEPEAMVELTNAIFRLTDNYRDIDAWWRGIEDDLALTVRDRDSLEVGHWALRNADVRMYYMTVENPARDALMEGEHLPSAYESIAAEAQAELDELFGW